MAIDSEGEGSGSARRRVQVVRLQEAEPAGPALEQAQRLPAAGRRRAAAAADVGLAAAAAAVAGGPAGPPWQHFHRQREARHARHDCLSASIFLAVIIAARFRVGDMPSSAQEAHGLALVFLTAAVMMWGQELAESGWGGLRALVLLALKFGAATCPLFRFYSQELFSEHPKAAGPPAVAAALLRTAVADHTGLLLLLGTILPQHIVADVVAQFLFFLSLSSQTAALCNTVYMRVSLRTLEWLSFVGTMRGCVAFVATSQLWVGVVLPLLLSVRRESAAATRFARENGIPPADRRRRVYSWLHRATSLTDPLSAKLAAGLLVCYAAWAAAAWAYLGQVYG
ncbi:hypothetical protein ABPG75_004276 [Micractinium tetrahymenae]